MSLSDDRYRPVLHVIAGPNGAGKTTLFRQVLEPRHPGAEFVNADELARERFGHVAQTLAESQEGQALADDRRSTLMAQGKSLFTETTFSHPSKLKLIDDAKARGYEVRVYHVNVRSPNISVLRVADRVDKGGHPVPEDKIRQRYERNQSLIRDAVRRADKAMVFDNSRVGERAKQALSFRQGRVVSASTDVPGWARALYAEDLARFTPERLNAPAASFAAARILIEDALGPGSRTFIPRPGARYAGEIIGETEMHIVQRLSARTAVAHFRDRVRDVDVGQTVSIQYASEPGKAVSVVSLTPEKGMSREPLVPATFAEPSAPMKSMTTLLDAMRTGNREQVQALLASDAKLREAVELVMKSPETKRPGRPGPSASQERGAAERDDKKGRER